MFLLKGYTTTLYSCAQDALLHNSFICTIEFNVTPPEDTLRIEQNTRAGVAARKVDSSSLLKSLNMDDLLDILEGVSHYSELTSQQLAYCLYDPSQNKHYDLSLLMLGTRNENVSLYDLIAYAEQTFHIDEHTQAKLVCYAHTNEQDESNVHFGESTQKKYVNLDDPDCVINQAVDELRIKSQQPAGIPEIGLLLNSFLIDWAVFQEYTCNGYAFVSLPEAFLHSARTLGNKYLTETLLHRRVNL